MREISENSLLVGKTSACAFPSDLKLQLPPTPTSCQAITENVTPDKAQPSQPVNCITPF